MAVVFVLLQVNPASSDILGQLVAAAQAHEWLMFSAVAIGFIVAMTKQGWLGTWIATRIPSSALPYYAMVLGFAGTFTTDVVEQKPWQQAMLDAFSGLLAAFIAIAGHQTVIERMRGGKELVPKAPWHSPPGSGGGGAPDVVRRAAEAMSAKDVTIASKFHVLGRWAVASLVAICLSAVTVTTGCTPAQWLTIETVAKDFISYVNTFLPAAEAIWALILPSLGTNGSAADASFQKAYVDVSRSLAALQDALHAADAVNQPVPDLTTLMQSVKDAVAQVMAIIDQYKTSGHAAIGAPADALHAQARAIAVWK
jgi:hypothetical protein